VLTRTCPSNCSWTLTSWNTCSLGYFIAEMCRTSSLRWQPSAWHYASGSTLDKQGSSSLSLSSATAGPFGWWPRSPAGLYVHAHACVKTCASWIACCSDAGSSRCYNNFIHDVLHLGMPGTSLLQTFDYGWWRKSCTAIVTLAYCAELLDPATSDSSINSDTSINHFWEQPTDCQEWTPAQISENVELVLNRLNCAWCW
jgi:hypothetical protein